MPAAAQTATANSDPSTRSPDTAYPAALPVANSVTSQANASVTVPVGASSAISTNAAASSGASPMPDSSDSPAIAYGPGSHSSGR